MKIRDTQRIKLYRAERKSLHPLANPLPTVKDVEGMIARVWASKRVHDAWGVGRNPPYVKDGRGTRIARGGFHHINIPLWARNEAVVLHEIAHVICSRHYSKIAPHGWQFAAVELKLVLWFMGREAHDALKAAFKANRVRFTKPRARRALSAEQKRALSERMALLRARKQEALAASPKGGGQ